VTSDAAAPPPNWWDQDGGERGTDPGVLELWRKVVARSGLCEGLSEEDRRRARHAALELAGKAYRRQRRGKVFGAVRLVIELLAILVAVLGLTAFGWPDALPAALGLGLVAFVSVVFVAQLPAWVRVWRGRGGTGPALGGGDLATTVLLALSAWGLTVSWLICRGSVSAVRHFPFLAVRGAAPDRQALPRWSWGGPRPAGGAGSLSTLVLIGATAAVVHLAALVLAGAFSRYRHGRRVRRDPLVGVVLPMVELLDLLTPPEALAGARDAERANGLFEQANGLFEQAKRNLLRARHPSDYPDRVNCGALAEVLGDLAFSLFKLPGGAAGERDREVLRNQARAQAAEVLRTQVTALFDDAGRVRRRRSLARGKAGMVRAAADSLVSPGARADGIDAHRAAPRPPGWGGLGVVHLGLIAAVGYAALRNGTWATADIRMQDVAGYVVLCGGLAMLVIESVRAVLSVRAIYHRRLVRRWLADRVGRYGDAALEELDLLLATKLPRPGARPKLLPPGRAATIYDLPAEQFLAQVDFVVEHVVPTSPGVPHVAEAFLGPGGRPAGPGAVAGAPALGAGDDGSVPLAVDVTDEQAREQRQVWDQQVRSVWLVTSMNQLQTWLTHGWLRQVRLTSCWLSGWLAFALAGVTGVPGGSLALFVCAATVFGGFSAEGVRRILGMVPGARPQ
jgi:hypothetical protein